MGLLITVIIAFFVGVILIIYGNRNWKEGAEVLGFVLTIICGLILVVMLLLTTTLSSKFAYIEEEYNNLKNQLEKIDHDDIVTGENLRNQVLEMNNKISMHKCYSQNKWVSMYFSEHIGNLEPLEWKSKNENN